MATPKRRRWDAILDRIPEGSRMRGAEVGVLMANTSMRLLVARPLITHIMIDAWMVPEAGSSYAKSGDDNSAKDQDAHEAAYQTTLRRVSQFGDRAVIMRMMSDEACRQIEDGSLDYVFIDADHSYEGVRDDIDRWLPKVKAGGWIGGHDYEHPRFPGVSLAVFEAFGAYPNPIETDDNRTWFVRIVDAGGF